MSRNEKKSNKNKIGKNFETYMKILSLISNRIASFQAPLSAFSWILPTICPAAKNYPRAPTLDPEDNLRSSSHGHDLSVLGLSFLR